MLRLTVKPRELTRTKWLSLRPFTCNFVNNDILKYKERSRPLGYDELGQIVTVLRSGEYIPKKHYADGETDYVYLSVNNFSKESLDLTECVFLKDSIGRQYEPIKIDPGDLVITRSGTVGRVGVFLPPTAAANKTFIPSHHLAILKTSTPSDHVFLKHYLNCKFCRDFFEALSTGKVQKEITNWAIRKIPIPRQLNRKRLGRMFLQIDKRIGHERKKAPTLQSIIGDVLVHNRITVGLSTMHHPEVVIANMKSIAANSSQRLGAQYNGFWIKHNGYLFEEIKKTNIVLFQLRYLVKSGRKVLLRKGGLAEPRILIDFDQVEPLTGRIIDHENIVSELGSDKIEFGDCDVLTNKLRPYLGYTILNDRKRRLIGTTEFLPFVIKNKKKLLPAFLRYLLLSGQYLQKSKFLMSGKQHPRINAVDILNLRIPVPLITVQKRIARKIVAKEKQSQQALRRISVLKDRIEIIIGSQLNRKQRA